MPVLGSLGPLSFVSKKEIDNPQEPPRVRLRRELVALQDVVYIDRRRRFGAPAVNARMVEVMRTGAPVVLFAEAAMGDGNRLQRLRSSHFEAARLAACSDNEGASVIQPSISTIRASPGCRRLAGSDRASPGTARCRFSRISCSTPGAAA